MLFTTIEVNFPLLIPVVIALVSAVVGPLLLSRSNANREAKKAKLESTGELSVRIIDEGRDMRKELRERIDALEARLADATQAFLEAQEEIRSLRSENERCTNMIHDLRAEVEKNRKIMNDRVASLESPDYDSKVETDARDLAEEAVKRDDRITALENSNDSEANDAPIR